MKKCKFLLLIGLMFSLLIPSVDAITIRETMDESDSYTVLENGSIIIGVTRFTPNKVVTASRAATAGADDVKLHILQNDNIDNYENPGVYYYVDSYVGWFFLDSDNKATAVTDEDELEKLSKLDIYYVDNEEKVLDVDVTDVNVLEDSLPDGVKYKDNKLYVNATISKFEIKTVDNEVIKFEFDSIASKFISEKIVMVDSITLNKTELTLDVGDSETLVAEILPDDATDKDIVWKSSDESVVTVDDNGKVSAISDGSAVITASVDGKSVECSVTVNKEITYQWEKIDISIVDQYYLYIVDSNGNKVSGRVNIKYNNDKNKEFNISSEGIKIVKSAVSSIEIISID